MQRRVHGRCCVQKWWDPEWRAQELARRKEDEGPGLGDGEIDAILQRFMASGQQDQAVPEARSRADGERIAELAAARGLHWCAALPP